MDDDDFMKRFLTVMAVALMLLSLSLVAMVTVQILGSTGCITLVEPLTPNPQAEE